MTFWVAIALVSALLFGASTPLSKLLLEQVSPFQLAGLLYLGAALGVSPFAIRKRVVQRVVRLDRANQVRLAGAVVLGGMAGPVLLLLGLRVAAAASVSLWLNLELVATAVLGVVLFRDQLTGRAWVGAGLVVAAALLLSWQEQSAGLLPGLLVALACVCWGFDNHFTSLIDGLTPQETTLWKGLVAGATNLAIGLAVSSWSATAGATVAALGLGALAYGASIVLYIAAAQNIGARGSSCSRPRRSLACCYPCWYSASRSAPSRSRLPRSWRWACWYCCAKATLIATAIRPSSTSIGTATTTAITCTSISGCPPGPATRTRIATRR